MMGLASVVSQCIMSIGALRQINQIFRKHLKCLKKSDDDVCRNVLGFGQTSPQDEGEISCSKCNLILVLILICLYFDYVDAFAACHKTPVLYIIAINKATILVLLIIRVAEVAREHGWHPPKSLDSDENFKPEHTLFCRELRFVAIYALFLEIFGIKGGLFG